LMVAFLMSHRDAGKSPAPGCGMPEGDGTLLMQASIICVIRVDPQLA
jgi:hypothetical protein